MSEPYPSMEAKLKEEHEERSGLSYLDPKSPSGYVENCSAKFHEEDRLVRAGQRRSGWHVPGTALKNHPLPGDKGISLTVPQDGKSLNGNDGAHADGTDI